MENQLVDWWFAKSKRTAFNIIDHGHLNPTDGPDILSATISINNIVYSGEIEFDWNFNGWFKHGHFQNTQFRNCLLHIYQVGNPVPYAGNQPKFTYNPHSKTVLENKSYVANFLERKYQFFESFSFLKSTTDLFWLLLGRSLGYFHNRDAMTYFVLRCLEQPIFDHKKVEDILLEHHVSSSSKQVRPNNRIAHRTKQWLEIWNTNIDLSDQLFQLISNRLPLSKLTTLLLQQTNQHISKQYKLSRQRLNLFLLNGLIPLVIYRTATDNIGFINYLIELMTKLSMKSDIQAIHRNQSIL